MIKVNNLSFTYEHGSAPALKDVTLHVKKGDFLGIIGESGAGKTTLTSAINGLIPHHYHGDYFGSVEVDGVDTFDAQLSDLSLVIGTVSQDIDSQMVAAVVEDELLFGLENFGVPHDQIEGRMLQALEAVGIPDLRNRRIATLSGGQKQKVAIAAILALRPDVILLDEPTGELDPVSSRQIFDVLRELNQHGVTVVVVEQKVMLLCEYAARIAVMDKGRIVLEGTVADVLRRYKDMERIGINCPRVATLCDRMTERGVGDGRVVATVADACSYVKEVLS
ncbi:energy-coupling factor ABC transporter ATP-binding protein [Adlercreutzia sp. ZJ141]|uniref:energy-coupling factor ABC transporter ATP-binding protein n=1 Tax=Adlercreutzia sp. ZJ141 TaxID=2709406 RepID=UPI0013EA6209|nr:ABC transporter ATP-binding protein [Adlercreutzia sp. ZJ141]